MKWWIGVRMGLYLSVLMAITGFTPAAAQDRVALVVGNSKYVSTNSLPNASNDARAMAKTLREMGFTVAEGVDLDRNGMELQIREFLRRTSDRKSVV